MAKSVFPAPALPQISVGRPAGSPPPVISSKPGIPVSSFCRPVLFERLRRFGLLNQKHSCWHTGASCELKGTIKTGGARQIQGGARIYNTPSFPAVVLRLPPHGFLFGLLLEIFWTVCRIPVSPFVVIVKAG